MLHIQRPGLEESQSKMPIKHQWFNSFTLFEAKMLYFIFNLKMQCFSFCHAGVSHSFINEAY